MTSDKTPRPPRTRPASDLDDMLDGDVPDADEAATASEKARAASFAELIDKAITGRTPPALSADERALLEVTTVIRAAARPAELAPGPRRAVIEQALASALGQGASHGAARNGSLRLSGPMDTAQPIRSGRGRWVPWALAAATTAMAAAAGAALWLRAPRQVMVSAPAPVPLHWRSRPADALVGEIHREDAGDAAARLDSIYSDRLDGFREATLFHPRGER
jgi:hypothetical protein